MEKTRFDKMLGNKEIRALITAMGPSPTLNEDTVDLSRLRYHKIVIMTDADVDGAHIRTLLLTFFYRQYQPLIDNGYIYIAQPPLYRVHKGDWERFIKDDKELSDFLLSRVTEDLTVTGPSGETFANGPLRDILAKIQVLHSRFQEAQGYGIPEPLLWSFLNGDKRLSAEDFAGEPLEALSNRLAEREYLLHVEHVEDETEQRSFAVFVNRNGVKTRLGLEFFASRVYRQCWTGLYELHKTFAGDAVNNATRESAETEAFSLVRKDVTSKVQGIFELLKAVLDEAHKGLNIQRYKGLGEMNPVQLWETTMNPEKRLFLKVSVDDATDADDVFTNLMGDKVEPRKEFIERNALSVRELDI